MRVASSFWRRLVDCFCVEQHLGPPERRLRLAQTRFGALNRGPGHNDLGLLLGGMEAGQNIALGNTVALIGMQLDECRSDFEADLRDDPRLNRAKPEDPHGHILFHSLQP